MRLTIFVWFGILQWHILIVLYVPIVAIEVVRNTRLTQEAHCENGFVL